MLFLDIYLGTQDSHREETVRAGGSRSRTYYTLSSWKCVCEACSVVRNRSA